MKISVEWLNQYLEKPLTARQMADAMELAGIEVEAVIAPPAIDPRAVVGRVLDVRAHPNADRLKIAKVDVNKSTLSIVCGAPNLESGQTVVVAQVGSVLPGDFEIKQTQIRGEPSEGMLCSPQELGLGDDHSGILVLPSSTQVGEPASQVLPTTELIDISTAANRWDLNGYAGLAIEVAAHSKQRAHIPEPTTLARVAPLSEVQVDPQLSPRYMLARLSVDNTMATPPEIVARLEAAGTRPINLVVDITNYVMMEYGQPLHAFDGNQVKGGVTVRAAHKGEPLVTLDGQPRKLAPSDIVIADTAGPLGLAGVMGGKASQITTATTMVLLESASFPGIRLRQTAQRLGLRTDASARFERGIPLSLPPVALARAVELLIQHASAKLVAGPADTGEPPAATIIEADHHEISKLLGIKLTGGQIATQLARLEFKAKVNAKTQRLQVTVPWWRNDLTSSADVAEEVMKLVGYDQLPATIPAWRPSKPVFDNHWARLWRAKSSLQASGLFELTTYSFISEEQITDLGWEPEDFLKLKNPLSREQAYLRRELLPSLLTVAERNRQYRKRFGAYEISKVYQPSRRGDLPHEPYHLAVVVVGDNSFKRAKATLDRLAADLNAKLRVAPPAFDQEVTWPNRSGEILVRKQRIGTIAQLHPGQAKQRKLSEASYFELDWEALIGSITVPRAPELSRFPAVKRDLAVVVDRSISWQQITGVLTRHQIEFLSDYYGDDLPAGKKVVAMRATFQQPDRTLTDGEADRQAAAMLKILVQKLKAKPR